MATNADANTGADSDSDSDSTIHTGYMVFGTVFGANTDTLCILGKRNTEIARRIQRAARRLDSPALQAEFSKIDDRTLEMLGKIWSSSDSPRVPAPPDGRLHPGRGPQILGRWWRNIPGSPRPPDGSWVLGESDGGGGSGSLDEGRGRGE